MRKRRIFLLFLALYCGLMSSLAQSVTITEALQLRPMASAVTMYKNQFGKWEKPDLDITFPYSVIRMYLDGDAREVTLAKQRLTLYMGTMTAVLDVYKENSNEILFLVPARRPTVYIDCGDGCERVLLSDNQQLQPNGVYDCTVRFTLEKDGSEVVKVVDKEVILDELRAELLNMMQEQQASQNEENEVEEEPVDTIIEDSLVSIVPQDTLSKYQRYVQNAKIRTFIVGQIGYSATPQLSYGAMIGQMYNGYGWFINGRSNFNFTQSTDGLSCQQGGWIGDELPFYTGTTSSVWNVNAGFVCDIFASTLKPKNHFHSLGLYIGVGYGKYERLWQISDGRWVRYAPSFTSGVSANIGIIGSFYGVTLTVGVNTINFNYMDIEAGIGYMF